VWLDLEEDILAEFSACEQTQWDLDGVCMALDAIRQDKYRANRCVGVHRALLTGKTGKESPREEAKRRWWRANAKRINERRRETRTPEVLTEERRAAKVAWNREYRRRKAIAKKSTHVISEAAE